MVSKFIKKAFDYFGPLYFSILNIVIENLPLGIYI